jgi:stringent starvation protein B
MTPLKPYLIDAIRSWVIDNSMTPYILVDAAYPGANVPTEYIENGKIILNINFPAVDNFMLDRERITFSTRFSGKSFNIVAPMGAILAVYAKENGKGMVFDTEPETPETDPEPKPVKTDKPKLRVVK